MGVFLGLAFGLAAISVWGCERATVGLADGRTQSAATETGHCRRGRKPFHCEATAHGPWVALRPNLKKEPINKNKRICKLSCAPQLQVWYAVEKMYFRLQFQCGEHLFSGGRKQIFVNKWLCLFTMKQSATSLRLFPFVCFPA